MKTILGLLTGLAIASAQTPSPTVAANCSISGVVRAQGTNEPIPDAEVAARVAGSTGRPVQTKSDPQGRYTLRSLEPGSYTVFATVRPAEGPGFGAQSQRTIDLQPDQELTGMDIRVRMPAQIAGRVLDPNGEPLANMTVALVAREYSFGALRHVIGGAATTDDQGRYTISRVTPGRAFLVMAMKRQMQLPAISDAPDDPDLRRPAPLPTYYPDSPNTDGAEPLTLRVAERREGVDIRVRMPAQIAGRVLDPNGEPLANMTVALVAREYSFGALRHVIAGAATTDDQGRYTISRVTPGRAFLVMAMKRQMQLPAISDAPDDPDLRRPAPLPTYYPDSPNADGAEPLTLRVSERREGVDVRVRKARSFCIDGVVSGPGPSDLRFTIAPPRPHSGLSGDGGVYMGLPGGKPGPDGKIRICDLPPGDYDLEATQWPAGGGFGGPEFMGVARVTIAGRDVSNVRANALPKRTVLGEVVWDGPPPAKPIEAELSINLTSISRTIRPSAKSKIPGEFAFEDMVLDDYSMVFRGLSGSQYLKDVTYGGQSIRNKTLRPGAAPSGSGVRVIVAPDGAFLSATVKAADDKPGANVYVFVFPAVTTEVDLAAFLVTGVTNQNGSWKSPALAPGKYYVLAGESPLDKSPESIEKLMQARSRAREVTLAPNGTATVTLEVKGVE